MNGPGSNYDGSHEVTNKDDDDNGRVKPLIGPGELIENVNKRSESANRKYRAFKNFLKYQNKTQSTKQANRKPSKSEVGPTPGSEEPNKDEKQEVETKLPQLDELSASDADDDFDDRYIHLSKYIHDVTECSCCALRDKQGVGRHIPGLAVQGVLGPDLPGVHHLPVHHHPLPTVLRRRGGGRVQDIRDHN